VDRAVVGTGFPFRRKHVLERYLEAFRGALERFEDLRRPGAASLDLAWVASGVFEGFFELGLAPWDVAAGMLLVREAGGTVTDFSGKPWAAPESFGHETLASNGRLHPRMLRLIRKNL